MTKEKKLTPAQTKALLALAAKPLVAGRDIPYGTVENLARRGLAEFVKGVVVSATITHRGTFARLQPLYRATEAGKTLAASITTSSGAPSPQEVTDETRGPKLESP
jgi:hypothetical protein